MEVADRILAALGKPESLKTIVPDRPGHDRRYILDSSKLRRELGWAPSIEWEQGLADTVALVCGATGTGGSRCGPGPRSSRDPGAAGGGLSSADPHHGGRRAAGPRPARVPWRVGSRRRAAAARCSAPKGPRPGLRPRGAGHRHRHHARWTTATPCCHVQRLPARARPARRGPHRGRPVRDRGRRGLRRERHRHPPRRRGRRARSGAHMVYVSTDYVFDGTREPALPGVGRPVPDVGLRRLQAGR